jgi:nucleoside-diphosphate-sugar epimerase
MSRVLVLGAEGYLGRHLVKKLKSEPSNIVLTTDRRDLDLRDGFDCWQYLVHQHPDEIYQLAADSGSMEYILSDKFSYGDSTLMNINVITALKNTGFKGRILFPSSFYAYNTANKYGIEKLYNEHLYLNSGLDVRIARLFSIYGPGEELNSPREKVTTAFCRKVIQADIGKPLILRGRHDQVRYFLYITDAIDALITQMLGPMRGCYDVAGSKAINFQKLIDEIITVDSRNIRTVWANAQWEEPITPLNRLNWKPKIEFEAGIKRLYNWVGEELNELH